MSAIVATSTAAAPGAAAQAGIEPLLRVEHLTMRFGGLVAIDDVSFEAKPEQITAIIGPNGAGKTTVFNCLTGFYKPKPCDRAHRRRSPQGRARSPWSRWRRWRS